MARQYYIDRRTRTCVVSLLQELLDGGHLLLGRARLLLLRLVILDRGLGSRQNHLYTLQFTHSAPLLEHSGTDPVCSYTSYFCNI